MDKIVPNNLPTNALIVAATAVITAVVVTKAVPAVERKLVKYYLSRPASSK